MYGFILFLCQTHKKLFLVDHVVDMAININKFERIFMYFDVIKNIRLGFKSR